MSRSKRKELQWLTDMQALFAPESAIGKSQIIPTTGAHVQIPVDDFTLGRLIAQAKIVYDPEYGPGARVYRPIGTVDAETIKEWL